MIETILPQLCTNLVESPNSSNVLMEGYDSMIFSIQDRDLVFILEDLENIDFPGHNNNTETSQLKDYFYLETVFNLIKNALTETEILEKVLEKGSDCDPIQSKVNELELCCEECCRRMPL